MVTEAGMDMMVADDGAMEKIQFVTATRDQLVARAAEPEQMIQRPRALAGRRVPMLTPRG